MNTIFMNSENSKTSKRHVLKLKLTSKLDLKIGEKVIALSNLSIYYIWWNIKSSFDNNKFKISAPTWNDEFELPDGSHSVSDIQGYFKYILKKHGENINKQSLQIYVNKTENKITLEIQKGYSLEILTPETMKLLGSTENKIKKTKTVKIVSYWNYWSSISSLSIMIISTIIEYYIRLFRINHLVVYYKFLQQIINF